MKAQIKKYIQHAFKSLGDITTNAIIKHKTGSEFNDSTGMLEETFTNYPVIILIEEYDQFEIYHSIITPGDMKVLLPVAQIDFVPKPADDTLIINDTEYSIETVSNQHNTLYILKI